MLPAARTAGITRPIRSASRCARRRRAVWSIGVSTARMSTFAIAPLLQRFATMTGVSPSSSIAVTHAPASTSAAHAFHAARAHAQCSGVLPPLSGASSVAPTRSRNSTAFSLFWYAAQCSAVCPSLSTASTFTPWLNA